MRYIYYVLILFIFLGCDKISTKDEVYYKNRIVYYKQNKKEFTGKLKTTYNNSKNIFSIIEYKNGLKNGKAIWYYKNKKIKQEAIYKNGKVDGVFKGYYPNGKLKSTIIYKNGKYTNDITIYDTNGNIIQQLSSK